MEFGVDDSTMPWDGRNREKAGVFRQPNQPFSRSMQTANRVLPDWLFLFEMLA
jgi:hypothetical protein